MTAVEVITQPELTAVMESFGLEAAHLAQQETHTAFPGGWFRPEHTMALGLRETGLQNICGGAALVDGKWEPVYTDRGWLQITDTIDANAKWLESIPGCPNGQGDRSNWEPDMRGFRAGKTNALTPMHSPTLSAALTYTLRQIAVEREQAYQTNVEHPDVLRFVIAAHNAGFHGALAGYEAGNVDAHTTLGNYSAWVLANAPAIAEWIRARPNWIWHA